MHSPSKGKWQKGVSGNPRGRPQGSRNKATLIAQELLDGEAEAITRKVIERAKAGDLPALKLCLERILPPGKERTVHFDLPPIETAADVPLAFQKVFAALAEGALTPAEAGLLVNMFERFASAVEVADLTRKVEELGRHVFKT